MEYVEQKDMKKNVRKWHEATKSSRKFIKLFNNNECYQRKLCVCLCVPFRVFVCSSAYTSSFLWNSTMNETNLQLTTRIHRNKFAAVRMCVIADADLFHNFGRAVCCNQSSSATYSSITTKKENIFQYPYKMNIIRIAEAAPSNTGQMEKE